MNVLCRRAALNDIVLNFCMRAASTKSLSDRGSVGLRVELDSETLLHLERWVKYI